MAEIHGESGHQFDPSVVDALERGVTRGDIDLAGTLAVAAAGA
jgi:hypothetical protein